MSKQRAVDIRQDDYFRVLLTETIPVEVPLFFSNIGLYSWARSNLSGRGSSRPRRSSLIEAVLSRLLVGQKNNRVTRPYEYDVRVSPTKQRRLSIAHPRSQLAWVDLYKRRHPLFTYYCGRSDWSLRSPSRVASRTYVANPDENLYKLKLNAAGVDVDGDHWRHRHAATFFSYRGYRRLYRFFESNEFLKLEQRFPVLWMLDINNCFGSIYTHSVSWATRSKVEIKRNLGSSKCTFGGAMDRALQSANWAETSGILVGPELSRIFAEIILQDVDLRVCRALDRQSCRNDYSVRRYVDDYFVFATDDVVAGHVVDAIRKQLDRYNLHLNTSKTTKYARPFITEKSRAIELAKVVLSDLEGSICAISEESEEPDADVDELTQDEQAALIDPIDAGAVKRVLVPRAIRSVRRLKASTIRKIKATCADNPAGYDLVGGYVFPALVNLMAKLYDTDPAKISNATLYARPAELILELLYFLYSVSPSVGHSVRLANASLLSLSFFSSIKLVGEKPRIEEAIYRAGSAFLEESFRSRRPGSAAGLEELNVLTIMGQLGADFELPWSTLRKWIVPAERPLSDLDYFAFAVLIQYAGNRPDFDDARAQLGAAVLERIRRTDPDSLMNSTESALMVLDFLSCPYLDDATKGELLQVTADKLGVRKTRSAAEISECIETMASIDWFSDWNDVYLYRSLERSNRSGFY